MPESWVSPGTEVWAEQRKAAQWIPRTCLWMAAKHLDEHLYMTPTVCEQMPAGPKGSRRMPPHPHSSNSEGPWEEGKVPEIEPTTFRSTSWERTFDLTIEF